MVHPLACKACKGAGISQLSRLQSAAYHFNFHAHPGNPSHQAFPHQTPPHPHRVGIIQLSWLESAGRGGDECVCKCVCVCVLVGVGGDYLNGLAGIGRRGEMEHENKKEIALYSFALVVCRYSALSLSLSLIHSLSLTHTHIHTHIYTYTHTHTHRQLTFGGRIDFLRCLYSLALVVYRSRPSAQISYYQRFGRGVTPWDRPSLHSRPTPRTQKHRGSFCGVLLPYP